MTCFRRVLIFLSVLLLFSFSSCGYVKRTQVKSAIDEAHQEFRSGDFQKALDTYQLAYKKSPKDPEMLKNYIGTIESMKAQGDEAFDRENFVQAQITYDLLLKNFPRFSNFANLLSFNKNLLVTRLKMSRVLPAEKQVQSYLKSGDVQKGIDIYRGLIQQYPWDTMVRYFYVSLLESIKEQADLDFKREDFAQAQITYDLLLKNFPQFSNFANLLSFNKNLLVTRLKMSRVLQAEKQAQSYLKSGDIQKGIEIYRSLTQQYPSDTTVSNLYISLLESIKGQADLDFKRKDFAPAGRTYRILLKNYSSLSHLNSFLSYNAGLLDTGIETCRKILFEDALEQYRSGNLSQAISIWRNILSFDPENLEVKKARNKAILQTRNLEKFESDDTK
jgi:tetratricopeptide (TPR) repeat protein